MTVRSTLYDIQTRYRTTLELAQDPEIPAEVIDDTLESIEAEVEDKLAAMVAIAVELQTKAAARRTISKGQAECARSLEGHAERLLGRVTETLRLMGKTSLELPEFVLSLRNNAESLDITDEARVPEHYTRTRTELDTAAIKADLKAGVEVPGARLVRTQSLRIK